MTETKSRAGEHYREFGPMVYRCCLRILKDREAARDATQEVFLKLVREISDLDDAATALRWMYRVARNHCLNVRRDARQWREDDAELDLDIAADASPDLCSDRLLAQALLSRFDVATQAVVVAVILEGREHEEVAAALGVSCVTVARKLERFLKRSLEYVTSGEDAPTVEDAEATPARSCVRHGFPPCAHRVSAARRPALAAKLRVRRDGLLSGGPDGGSPGTVGVAMSAS